MRARPTAERTNEIRLTPDLARTLVNYLAEARENERGGVLLGRHEDRGISVSSAVFPPQLVRARNHCAFDIRDIDVVREAMSGLIDRKLIQAVGTIVGWVHSHPAWGVFMSGTDKDTLKSWISLDDRAIAIVVDPFVREPKKRIAWWDKSGRGRLVAIRRSGSHSISIQQASRLAQAISDEAAAGRWDVLVPKGIITVFSASTDGLSHQTE
jgi:proteasome lid subunit RPN8/RPN11